MSDAKRTLKKWLTGLLAALLSLLLATAGLLWLQREKIMLGAEGYLYGLPLVLMDLTRKEFIAHQAPENQLRHARQTPTAAFREVVRPTVDVLYTSAFIDLAQGPWVLRLPVNPHRFEIFSLLDAWTDVYAAPSTRSHGGAGGSYLLAAADWQGLVPAGMTLLRGDTRMAWLIGRTQVLGAQDLPRVHALQDGVVLQPLGAAPRPLGTNAPASNAPASNTPASSAPRGAAPVAQLRQMATGAFFARLAQLMVDNPPRAADRPMLMKLARLGLAPGQAPVWTWLDGASVALGRWLADDQIRRELAKPRNTVQGWQTPPDLLGRFGTAYNIRAAVALIGLGANLPEDAMYPSTWADAEGQPLEGSHRYRIRFAPGALPPARAFWSVTAYGADNFLQQVPDDRHAVGSRDSLLVNPDGSVDLLIQATPPAAALRANWLPVRAGERFSLTARLYWPQAAALRGDWHMPPVQRLP